MLFILIFAFVLALVLLILFVLAVLHVGENIVFLLKLLNPLNVIFYSILFLIFWIVGLFCWVNICDVFVIVVVVVVDYIL